MQLIGATVWLIIEPPDTTEIHPYPLSAVLTCRVSTFSLMMSLVYNMFLILMCTLYAFKTRKIPENFNEAKYIGFTMYSTCIVWLAFVPIYFGSNNDYKVGVQCYRGTLLFAILNLYLILCLLKTVDLIHQLFMYICIISEYKVTICLKEIEMHFAIVY